jgi:hypothetical protein
MNSKRNAVYGLLVTSMIAMGCTTADRDGGSFASVSGESEPRISPRDDGVLNLGVLGGAATVCAESTQCFICFGDRAAGGNYWQKLCAGESTPGAFSLSGNDFDACVAEDKLKTDACGVQYIPANADAWKIGNGVIAEMCANDDFPSGIGQKYSPFGPTGLLTLTNAGEFTGGIGVNEARVPPNVGDPVDNLLTCPLVAGSCCDPTSPANANASVSNISVNYQLQEVSCVITFPLKGRLQTFGLVCG